ncbi:MAG: hypothetical protein ABSC49_00365 [Candidatus Microgenomates bacterium]
MNPQEPKNSWITILSVAIFILMALGIVAYLYYQNQALKSLLSKYESIPTATPIVISVTPSPVATTSASPKSKSISKYTCPASGYVDCMPSGNGSTNPNCSAEAMGWYKTNCPNFQGGAY